MIQGINHRAAAIGVASAAVLCALAVVWSQNGANADASATAATQTAMATPATDPLAAIKSAYVRPTEIPFPEDNAYSPNKVALGKLLYFDTRLSGSKLLSCASCHNPGYGWSDGQPLAVGHGMQILGRRSPTILNAAWGEIFFWDGRADSLETQALGPIASPGEMNMPLDQLVDVIAAIPDYVQLFDDAFPGEGITLDNIAKSIATFERTVVSSRAPFDAWIAGDETAIPDAAKRGFQIFAGKANCTACHSGWNMTDDSFHDIGLASIDEGRGALIPDVVKLQHAFKTPGLRDLTRRAPYMHDGSLTTLAEVVDHYDRGFITRPSLSEDMKPLHLTGEEKQDLLAFLDTLTGELAPVVVPVLPR